MSDDFSEFNNFTKLLKNNSYIPIEYFIFEKYCKTVKVIHINSGKIFFIQISKKYKISIPDDISNKYTIIQDNSNTKEFNSSYLSDYYPMIKINTNEDQVIDNISSVLKSNYKQQIVLSKNSSFEHIEQLKRIKYCFKTLEYKITFQTSTHLLVLNSENNIEVYEVQYYPNDHTFKTFYPIMTLEQFYLKIQVAYKFISEIDNGLFSVFNINQEKHNEHMTSQFVNNFINNNNKLIQIKYNLQQSQYEISSLLNGIHEKEEKLLDIKYELSNTKSGNIYDEANLSKRKEEVEKNYNKIHVVKLKLIDKIINLDNKIKNMYLVIDQLGFNLSVSLNELRNELNNIV